MSTTSRFGLAIALVVVALGLPTVGVARRTARPPCPVHRASDADPCEHVGQACSWRCDDEGDRDRRCACTRDPDDHLRWDCTDGPLCRE